MRYGWLSAAAAIVLGWTSGPAQACRTFVPINLNDVAYADTVIVGRVVGYAKIRDQTFRTKMLSNPRLSARDRVFYTDGRDLMGDYARIRIDVGQVLAGEAPRSLTVTWYNSTFGLPAGLPAGRLLIALRAANSPSPPLRGPSATAVPNREPGAMTLLQAPCSRPFVFDSGSTEAQIIRAKLKTGRP